MQQQWPLLTEITNFKKIWSLILIIVQRDGTQSGLFIILQVHSKCLGCQTTPIIRSTQNCNYSLRYCAATSLQRGQAWREVAAQKI